MQVERIQVPLQLLECEDAPAPPAEGTQRDVMRWIALLWAAGDDCRTKLGEVRALLKEERAP